MGTNYYWLEDVCPCCGHAKKETHIGKSSAGWCFSLHVTDEIKTLDDWKARFNMPNTKIMNEYDVEVPMEEMLNTITDRDWDREEKPYGYDSWEQFCERNHCELGPNGLVRSKIDGYCVGHGEGTWDYRKGEFS